MHLIYLLEKVFGLWLSHIDSGSLSGLHIAGNNLLSLKCVVQFFSFYIYFWFKNMFQFEEIVVLVMLLVGEWVWNKSCMRCSCVRADLNSVLLLWGYTFITFKAIVSICCHILYTHLLKGFIQLSLVSPVKSVTNQPMWRMTGEKLLFSVTVMSVLSLLTLHTSHGELLADEPCTVQILVPGLKGKSSVTQSKFKKWHQCEFIFTFYLSRLHLLKENLEKRGRKEHREDQEESARLETSV